MTLIIDAGSNRLVELVPHKTANAPLYSKRNRVTAHDSPHSFFFLPKANIRQPAHSRAQRSKKRNKIIQRKEKEKEKEAEPLSCTIFLRPLPPLCVDMVKNSSPLSRFICLFYFPLSPQRSVSTSLPPSLLPVLPPPEPLVP